MAKHPAAASAAPPAAAAAASGAAVASRQQAPVPPSEQQQERAPGGPCDPTGSDDGCTATTSRPGEGGSGGAGRSGAAPLAAPRAPEPAFVAPEPIRVFTEEYHSSRQKAHTRHFVASSYKVWIGMGVQGSICFFSWVGRAASGRAHPYLLPWGS